MSVKITILLSEREADALERAHRGGRSGWNSTPSVPLQTADTKIIHAVRRERANVEIQAQ